MAQVLKPEVRARILDAALSAFAAEGYGGTSMARIAEGAGMAVANLYRYYPDKPAIFDAVVPAALAAEHERLHVDIAQAHAHLVGPTPPGDPGAAEALLAFWVTHRREVVVLLTRAEGTPHEDFDRRFVDRLVEQTLAELRATHPKQPPPPEARLVLTCLFDNTRRAIAAILAERADGSSIRAAIAGFRAYQTAGLAAFARWYAGGA
jgi:AcrR family transcriptional regulator